MATNCLEVLAVTCRHVASHDKIVHQHDMDLDGSSGSLDGALTIWLFIHLQYNGPIVLCRAIQSIEQCIINQGPGCMRPWQIEDLGGLTCQAMQYCQFFTTARPWRARQSESKEEGLHSRWRASARSNIKVTSVCASSGNSISHLVLLLAQHACF